MRLRSRATSLLLGAESRVANPLVARVLRSSLHPLLSQWLLLLSYEGRRSGRRYTTPTLYRRTAAGVTLFTPAGATNRWRNFRGGHPISMLVRGTWHRGEGEVVTDDDAVLEHLRWLTGPLRPIANSLGARDRLDAWLERHARDYVLVRVSFAEGSRRDRSRRRRGG